MPVSGLRKAIRDKEGKEHLKNKLIIMQKQEEDKCIGISLMHIYSEMSLAEYDGVLPQLKSFFNSMLMQFYTGFVQYLKAY